jgi:hypothetical protein
MRQRVEDLGRIAVLTKNLLDHDLFEDRHVRNKDYVDWFSEQSEEKRDDIIHNMVYRIDDARDKIYEMLEIAEGTDPLNTSEGEFR